MRINNSQWVPLGFIIPMKHSTLRFISDFRESKEE